MSDLRLMAGAAAKNSLAQNGLRGRDFNWLAGASGGPKWFVLYGLDRYLAGEFFGPRNGVPLRMVGSSAGAWRLACYAAPDPVASLQALATHYSSQTYSSRPDRYEISREARKMLNQVLAANDMSIEKAAAAIASNQHRRLYVITDRARRLTRPENKLMLNIGLTLVALGNLGSRRSLRWFFERYVFHNACDRGADELVLSDMPTQYVPLSAQNVHSALMASGSIPLVMEAVTQVEGAPGAVFRDGGMTDYHLDLPYEKSDGLVLYPHFYASVVPGWFDKLARWRRANPAHFDNVVLVTPTKQFVDRLPYGKIPDRDDFRRLSDAQRLKYWQTVLSESERLADSFRELVAMGPAVVEHIHEFSNSRTKHV
ncbi:patatin-like phospholipase family protein [Pseudohongiella sp. SYSU M77423]|uniref:patatin-like phospholipase family protein n=1 Tax=Pseudohongiella sp. SYSU M77423 TaxID=3042312 RepID=UPI002480E29D|nr:patatin-like phospholipase family protein [Pseudohongiella sp. SYSU M77423]MDH7942398.1 patatin-like phospholipase family protein [Pseudohongiella sp. SYSU M77423]